MNNAKIRISFKQTTNKGSYSTKKGSKLTKFISSPQYTLLYTDSKKLPIAHLRKQMNRELFMRNTL